MYKAFIVFVLGGMAAASDLGLERAAELYRKTRYDAALQALEGIQNKDAAAFALQGRVYYGSGQYKESVEALDRATAAAPQNSEYWDWLGKAHGRRAETSSFFTAPKYASQCRKAFEKAVELDPRNVEALSDVFQYYLDAPGFLGGGVDKAIAVAARIKELDPSRYQYAQAQLAKKRKDFTAAGEHFRKAAEFAPSKVGPLLDLASFLSERGRFEESDALFKKARQMAPGDPEALFARASALVNTKRNSEEARQLLRQYLASELTPENPPCAEAEALLRRANGG